MYFQLCRQAEAIACILVRRLGALPFCELLHMSWMGVSLRYHRILDDQHRPRRDLRVKVVLLGNLVAIDKVVLRHLLFLLDKVVFGAYDFKSGVCGSAGDISSEAFFNHSLEITGGILERDCKEILQSFFKKLRD